MHSWTRACDGDAGLRSEVESLLRADAAGGSAIAAAIESEVSALLDDHASLVGTRMGPYRLLKEIGRGGMGAVYLGERDDEHYRKLVAIKVVKRGMDSTEVLARFRHERQILAGLEHPYIARLIDGGTTPDGRPFFVMEYVQGQPIDAYCREQGLNRGIPFAVVPASLRGRRRMPTVRWWSIATLSPAIFLWPPREFPNCSISAWPSCWIPRNDPGLTSTSARDGPTHPGVRQPRANPGLADHHGGGRLCLGGHSL